MVESFVQGAAKVTHWHAEHRTADGRLICRQAIVQPPEFGNCLVLTCLAKYVKAQVMFVLTLLYHKYRCEYAEKARDKEIPMRYRTGDDVPTSFWKLVWEIMRIPNA